MSHSADQTAEPAVPSVRRFRYGSVLIFVLLGIALAAGWLAAPSGLLGKADAIGYAVCHRIDARSFHLGERQLPLCARCTGTFLGALAGGIILFAFGRGRSVAWPPNRVTLILAATIIPWAFDGVNSYLTFFPQFPHLYAPQNWLRLTTGMLLGMSMSALFLPAVNQSLWKNPTPGPVLRNFRELLAYYALAPVLIALILIENPIILFPLAVLSSIGVLFLLTGVFTAILLMILRREGTAETWIGAAPALAAGLTLALLQIAAIDIVRWMLTGTWGGFTVGG